MKKLFFVPILLLLSVSRLNAQTLPALLEERKQLVLNSEIRLRQLVEPLISISSAKREAEADIDEQIKAVRQSVTNSYNQANGAISEKRYQGTIQDISLLGQTGDLGSGAVLAGFNMLTRKSKISGQKEANEADRKRIEQQAQEIRDRKMTSIEQQYAQQIGAIIRPVITAMNAFFVNRPPEPRLPGPSTPASQQFVYVYFGKPFLDRIVFSNVWRIDRAGNGVWTKVDSGKEPFELATDMYLFRMLGLEPGTRIELGVKVDMLQKASNRVRESLVYPVPIGHQPVSGLCPFLMGNLASYTYNDAFTMGVFTSEEAALQHQISLMQQATRANIAVEVVATPPQATLAEIRLFADQQDTYWGVRKGAEKPIAAENSSTQQKIRADQEEAIAAANMTKAQQEAENRRTQQDKERQLAKDVQRANKQAEEQRKLAEQQKQETQALQDQEKVAEEKRRETEKGKLASLAKVKATTPARVSTGATDKNDDFWGDGDSKGSPAQTSSKGSYYKQVDALVKIRVKLEADWLEILESDTMNQIPLGKYPLNSQGLFERKGRSFRLGTDQVLTFTSKNINLTFTPLP